MAASMDDMKKLMKKRDEIESEIRALHEVLDSQKGIGMNEPLVDLEGYPRADIDVYTVRHARHTLICLQNDHKALMKEIEEELYKIHAEARQKKGAGSSEETTTPEEETRARLSPFLILDKVDEDSPAHTCGVCVNDKVLKFGSVSSHNFQNLQNIATVVQHSKDKPLSLRILRGDKEFNLSLTPRTWSGRGLLGCSLLPIKKT
ncbi:26S proteasome non-ATPase regulatory subunit 9-like [Ostrea edulis]|uniref:26S proteasome non-ATPase regulatory subunit 9-like n=1 Tax=Ostrea edulis TaxID=37623 RepID=UPI0024AF37B7|nr:26S proteasome non-ATPase regulatory subunit 9-like [Ostrea edulis]